jgi:hypothetical protein
MTDKTTPIELSVDAARRAMLADVAREAEELAWKAVGFASMLRAAATDPTDGDER